VPQGWRTRRGAKQGVARKATLYERCPILVPSGPGIVMYRPVHVDEQRAQVAQPVQVACTLGSRAICFWPR
jgi:hypothetical protein